ncbi:MAG: CD225/dispanin family protein, partial [bacterium]|nr:CD225/dispanin family protein [bacterium]
CLPFGIVSIVKASQVSTFYSQGLYAEAEEASKSAGKWAMWGAIISVVATVLYISVLLMWLHCSTSSFF